MQAEWKVERLTRSSIGVRRSFAFGNDGNWTTDDDQRSSINRGRGNRLARASRGEGRGAWLSRRREPLAKEAASRACLCPSQRLSSGDAPDMRIPEPVLVITSLAAFLCLLARRTTYPGPLVSMDSIQPRTSQDPPPDNNDTGKRL